MQLTGDSKTEPACPPGANRPCMAAYLQIFTMFYSLRLREVRDPTDERFDLV